MGYDITFFKVIKTLKDELNKLGLEANIRQFYWYETPKPSLNKSVVIVATDKVLWRVADNKRISLGTDRIEDDVELYCVDQSLSRDAMQVFPIYHVGCKGVYLSTEDKHCHHPTVGFAYIDNVISRQLTPDLPAHEHYEQLPAVIDEILQAVTGWAYNKIYQAKLLRDSEVVWDSGFIYNTEDWTNYIEQAARNLNLNH